MLKLLFAVPALLALVGVAPACNRAQFVKVQSQFVAVPTATLVVPFQVQTQAFVAVPTAQFVEVKEFKQVKEVKQVIAVKAGKVERVRVIEVERPGLIRRVLNRVF